jgi:hypothetical protein
MKPGKIRNAETGKPRKIKNAFLQPFRFSMKVTGISMVVAQRGVWGRRQRCEF